MQPRLFRQDVGSELLRFVEDELLADLQGCSFLLSEKGTVMRSVKGADEANKPAGDLEGREW